MIKKDKEDTQRISPPNLRVPYFRSAATDFFFITLKREGDNLLLKPQSGSVLLSRLKNCSEVAFLCFEATSTA